MGAAVGAESWLKNDKLVETVETKVREIQLSRDEKRFDPRNRLGAEYPRRRGDCQENQPAHVPVHV